MSNHNNSQTMIEEQAATYDDNCIVKALGFVWVAFAPECGLRGQDECLCIRRTYCFEPCGCNNGTQPRGIGLVTEPEQGEFCKIGAYCCDYALVKPRVLIGCASHSLCVKEVGSFPFHEDYVDEPLCALYCVSCVPECDIAAEPPRSAALDRMQTASPPASSRMDRGQGPGTTPVAEAIAEPLLPVAEAMQVPVTDAQQMPIMKVDTDTSSENV